MESGAKDCEEETLQTAFKKLRVDAERAAARICEALAQKTEGGKGKGACPKENWHGCVRKTSRGTVRSQRRRRSKSPILHPPKFTYCSSKMSPPPGHLKHKSLVEGDGSSAALGVPAKKELLSSGHASPVFGAAGYEPHALERRVGTASPEIFLRPPSDDDEAVGAGPENPLLDRAARISGGGPPTDFQSLSRLQENGTSACSCAETQCRCGGWRGVEVYSFTGLRDVISECERNLAAPDDAAVSQTSPHRRTQTAGGNSGSPRSCSEQARAYVDDITIEDLSGYMEYYLYIPKKMSHMAEMMYT
ncbi:hypothetical protein JZ751_018013 [Albula glossodonta]|uniref:Oxidative stress-responsive serine-rich protein 1 n=1 Tax=Albula glossodonta TaxID=121402 RepID=A0A8T2PPX7_9TELE|nr:hypothetical protein JZ751_018013 [Albula glossodonta]